MKPASCKTGKNAAAVGKEHNGAAVSARCHGGAGRAIQLAETPDCPGNSRVKTAP